ncbi:lecithin retinol acyltransferase family protein [Ferrimonas balearica]|uniref:lecithin retinol acyltransferase family protein n=1 Tax=Ferrimonas balearica TaxID=44012 RepID=UPI001F45365B|nr:lecithin retinol acyltransferase family protein [Ferrimonas balearica]MBY6019704.1 lecithin retinol acyltransferase family protein [Halomonas denitrificans]MBY6096770.1 lecithin retinol acyltransferase family protein [Ferrimonas balearica]
MALPALIVLAGALAAIEYHDHRKSVQRQRHRRPNGPAGLALAPSQWLPGQRRVVPKPGAVLACHVFGVVEHTGIWLGENAIAELHGSGLVRAVSVNRFLARRSGATVFCLCDHQHQPLASESVAERAAAALFTYRDYHLTRNNCHRFVWHCLSGEDRAITSFTALNRLLAPHFGDHLYWDPVCLDQAVSGSVCSD